MPDLDWSKRTQPSRSFLSQKNCASGCITMTVFFDNSFTNMPERTYTSPDHFDKNLSRDIVDIIFSSNQFAHQLISVISPFKSFTTTNRGPALFIIQFFASASGFLLRKSEESFKRTDNSTKPPLTQIQLNSSSAKSAILSVTKIS